MMARSTDEADAIDDLINDRVWLFAYVGLGIPTVWLSIAIILIVRCGMLKRWRVPASYWAIVVLNLECNEGFHSGKVEGDEWRMTKMNKEWRLEEMERKLGWHKIVWTLFNPGEFREGLPLNSDTDIDERGKRVVELILSGTDSERLYPKSKACYEALQGLLQTTPQCCCSLLLPPCFSPALSSYLETSYTSCQGSWNWCSSYVTYCMVGDNPDSFDKCTYAYFVGVVGLFFAFMVTCLSSVMFLFGLSALLGFGWFLTGAIVLMDWGRDADDENIPEASARHVLWGVTWACVGLMGLSVISSVVFLATPQPPLVTPHKVTLLHLQATPPRVTSLHLLATTQHLLATHHPLPDILLLTLARTLQQAIHSAPVIKR
eukprot:gene10604-12272_t